MTLLKEFSAREKQVVAGLLEAKTVKDIAHECGLSVNTIKDYLKSIYSKADVHSARELMLRAALPPALAPLPADAGLAQLLRTAQTLGTGPSGPREMMAKLSSAVVRCTRARRVSFWRWSRLADTLCLVHESSPAQVRVGSFGHRVHTQGWARLEMEEVGSLETRQLAQYGLLGEIMGVACDLMPAAQVMLAGDADGGRLAPLDAATLRLLARLAVIEPPQRALRATA